MDMQQFQNFSKVNRYLQMIFNPYQFIVNVPDLNMTTTHLKPLTTSTTETVGDTGSFLLLWTPHSFGTVLRMFVYDGSRYVFWRNIDPDESLSDNYSSARPIAGGIQLKSDTISGTLFSISGQINAVRYNFLPNITDITHQEVPSYKSDQNAVITSERFSDGVICLMHPSGNHDFHPLATNAVTNESDVLTLRLPVPDGTSSITFDKNDDFPYGLTGPMTLKIFGLGETSAETQNVLVTIRYWSATGQWSNSTLTPIELLQFSYADNNSTMSIQGCWEIDVPGFIENITIIFTGVSPGEGISSASNSVYLSVRSTTYYEIGRNSPGYILSVSGASPELQIDIGAINNYEVVPDANLSRQIMTNSSNTVENPWELELAEWYISGPIYNSGLRWVDSISSYMTKLNSGLLDSAVKEERILSSGGFPEWLRRIFKATGPLAGTATSMLSGNPMLGSQVANALDTLSSKESLNTGGSYRNPYSVGGTYRNKRVPNRRRERIYDTASELDEEFYEWSNNLVSMSVTGESFMETTEYDESFKDYINAPGKVWTDKIASMMSTFRAQRLQANVPNDLTIVAFPAVDALTVEMGDGKIGYVACSSSGFKGEYTRVGIDEYFFFLGKNVVLDGITFAQVLNAVIQVAVSGIFIDIYVPDADKISGASIGLAVNMAVCGLHTPMCVTGALHENRLVGVTMIEDKLQLVRSFNENLKDSTKRLAGLVAAYDRDNVEEENMVIQLSDLYPYEVRMGMVNFGDPKEFFPVSTLAAATLICSQSVFWGNVTYYGTPVLGTVVNKEGKIVESVVQQRDSNHGNAQGRTITVEKMNKMYDKSANYEALVFELRGKIAYDLFMDNMDKMLIAVDAGDLNGAASLYLANESYVNGLINKGWLDDTDSHAIEEYKLGRINVPNTIVSRFDLMNTDYYDLMTKKEKNDQEKIKRIELAKKFSNLTILAREYKVKVLNKLYTEKRKNQPRVGARPRRTVSPPSVLTPATGIRRREVTNEPVIEPVIQKTMKEQYDNFAMDFLGSVPDPGRYMSLTNKQIYELFKDQPIPGNEREETRVSPPSVSERITVVTPQQTEETWVSVDQLEDEQGRTQVQEPESKTLGLGRRRARAF